MGQVSDSFCLRGRKLGLNHLASFGYLVLNEFSMCCYYCNYFLEMFTLTAAPCAMGLASALLEGLSWPSADIESCFQGAGSWAMVKACHQGFYCEGVSWGIP